MGTELVVVLKWFIVSFPLIFFKKEDSEIENIRRPSVSCLSSFTDDTIKACAFGSVFLLR